MIAATRKLLKQKLPSTAFRQVCYSWWNAKFYFPRRIASSVIQRHPVVHGRQSALVEQLRGINTFAPTDMCRSMTKFGSDKGNSWHNYTTVYKRLFQSQRMSVRRVFELGLGREHSDMADTAGASLRGWREIFPNALVFGADIDTSLLFTEERIQTFYCDQLDKTVIKDLWGKPQLSEKMDIIIEDGLHTFEGNICFLEASLGHVRKGGYYSIEDILGQDLGKWQNQLPKLSETYSDCDFALLELPSAFNAHDNNMLIIQKRG